MSIPRLRTEYRELVEAILESYPPETWTSTTTTFLEPQQGGGQFTSAVIARLRRAGHSDLNIAGRIWAFESTGARLRYAQNKHALIGEFACKTPEEFLEWNTTMRFSVVLGNPPYKLLATNGRQTNRSLWKDFLVRCSELLEPGGYMAMITPTGWCSPSDSGKIVARVFTEKNLCYADISTGVREHFPGVSSTFGWTLVENAPYRGTTRVQTDSGEVVVDLRRTPVLTSTGMSIMQRLTENRLPRCAWQHAGRAEQYPGTGYRTGTQPAEAVWCNIHHVNSSRDYLPGTKIPVRWSTEPSALAGVPKVVIPYNGPANPIVDGGTLGVGWCQVLRLQPGDNLEGARTVFTSALFRWFAAQRYTQYNETKNLRVFPMVDLSRNWTETQLMNSLGLTAAEQDFLLAWSAEN